MTSTLTAKGSGLASGVDGEREMAKFMFDVMLLIRERAAAGQVIHKRVPLCFAFRGYSIFEPPKLDKSQKSTPKQSSLSILGPILGRDKWKLTE